MFDSEMRYLSASARWRKDYGLGDQRLIGVAGHRIAGEQDPGGLARGIVDSGETLKKGIGAMTDANVASFFDKMVRAGVVKQDIDFRKAYTLRFINKAVGLELRPKN